MTKQGAGVSDTRGGNVGWKVTWDELPVAFKCVDIWTERTDLLGRETSEFKVP